MIDANKTMTGNDGFAQVPNIVFDMYPLLEGFDIETAGFYGYLCTWKQNEPTHSLFNCVWLTHEDMQAQAGIGRGRLNKNLDTLMHYNLVIRHKALNIPNKYVYEVVPPLTEAEFRAKYTAEMESFKEKMEASRIRIEIDRQQFPAKREKWKAVHVEQAQIKSEPEFDINDF